MGGLEPKGVVAQDQTPRYFGMRDVNLGRRGFLAQEQLAERRRIRSGFCGSRRAGESLNYLQREVALEALSSAFDAGFEAAMEFYTSEEFELAGRSSAG